MIVSFLEEKVGGRIRRDAHIMQWALRWAATLISNYQTGRDSKTAYERIKGRPCRTPLAIFGEKVLYKGSRDKKRPMRKIDSEWHEGVWLGVRGRTGESIIGSKWGVIKRTQ